jgi:hypothetical protein
MRMTTAAALALGVAVLGTGSTVRAAPTLNIRGAALRIVIVPEARKDIVVTLLRASTQLPIKTHRFGRTTFVSGDVGHRSRGCQAADGRRAVGIRGRGEIGFEDLPQLVARTPMDVRVNAGDSVFGAIGRSASLDIVNRGCGAWTIADISGRARINQAGSGAIRAGSAGEADLSVAGSGDIGLQAVRGGVNAVSSVAGDISVESLDGPFNIHIAGSGDVRARSGTATTMRASIAGSGGVTFRGVAHSLNVSIAGPGEVTVAKVDGPVKKQVFGPGRVNIGR